MRNALAYVPNTQQTMVAAALRQAFLQPDRAQASAMLRHLADRFRQKWPKLAAFIDDSETEVLSYLDFPSRTAANCTAPTRSNGQQESQTPRRRRRHLPPTMPRSSG